MQPNTRSRAEKLATKHAKYAHALWRRRNLLEDPAYLSATKVTLRRRFDTWHRAIRQAVPGFSWFGEQAVSVNSAKQLVQWEKERSIAHGG